MKRYQVTFLLLLERSWLYYHFWPLTASPTSWLCDSPEKRGSDYTEIAWNAFIKFRIKVTWYLFLEEKNETFIHKEILNKTISWFCFNPSQSEKVAGYFFTFAREVLIILSFLTPRCSRCAPKVASISIICRICETLLEILWKIWKDQASQFDLILNSILFLEINLI